MATTINFAGLGSGIDFGKITEALMQEAARPLNQLRARGAALQQKQVTVQSLNALVLGLRTSLDALVTPSNATGLIASSSSAATASASVTSEAAQGSFSLNVTKLATAEVRSSAGFADPGAVPLGTGTLNLTIGSGATQSVTITAANSSLNGLAKAINEANIGLKALVVNTGAASDPAKPYKLVLTSTTTGAANTISVDASGLDLNAISGSQALSFGAADVTAQDAEFTLNGLALTSASNTVTAVDGLSINLLAAGTATITVNPDNSGFKKGVHDFIAAYNKVNQLINEQRTIKGAPLAGDAMLRTVQEQLRGVLANLTTTAGQFTSLADIGIGRDISGNLALDSVRLDAALASNLADVKALFQTGGVSDTTGIAFSSATTATKAGTYAVSVTTQASQGTVTGTQTFSDGTVTLTNPETLTFTSGDKTVNLTLAAGRNLTQIISDINTALGQGGIKVIASNDGTGKLKLTTTGYGTAASFTVISTADANEPGVVTSGIGNTAKTGAGSDIVGSINGVAATGSGQKLTALVGDAAEGLSVLITAAAGTTGYVTVSRGIANLLRDATVSLTDTTTGIFTEATNGYKDSLRRLDDSIARLQAQIEAQRQSLERRFAAVDAAIGQLNGQNTALTSVLDSLRPRESK
jgi:flagellar hook-associated protein 2